MYNKNTVIFCIFEFLLAAGSTLWATAWAQAFPIRNQQIRQELYKVNKGGNGNVLIALLQLFFLWVTQKYIDIKHNKKNKSNTSKHPQRTVLRGQTMV